jgi:hypothetical protein
MVSVDEKTAKGFEAKVSVLIGVQLKLTKPLQSPLMVKLLVNPLMANLLIASAGLKTNTTGGSLAFKTRNTFTPERIPVLPW